MQSMGKVSILLALFLTLAVAISCLTLATVKSTNAQTTSTLSIPQFTLTFQDNSYVIQPITVTTTDPYTGKQTIVGSTSGGYVHNSSITVRVTNQPFTPYMDANNNTVQLYYGVRWKGQYTDTWEGSAEGIKASSGFYTDIPLGFTSNTYGWGGVAAINWHALGNPVDIQVEALEGYATQTQNSTLENLIQSITVLASSGWSSTQTIIASNVSTSPTPTISPSAATPSPTPNFTSPIPEFSWLVILPLLLSVFSVAVIVGHRKNR